MRAFIFMTWLAAALSNVPGVACAADVKATSADGTPSYVKLLTCLEIARDAKK